MAGVTVHNEHMTSTTCSFRKTKTGEWVVFGPARLVKPGTVTVSLANGGSKTVTVASVGKTFRADGLEACYGYTTGTSTTVAKPAAAKSPFATKSTGRYVCEECGEWVTAGVGRCWETGCGH